MVRQTLFALLALGLVGAPAQGPAAQPKIDLNASGASAGQGQGSVTVSGTITCPDPWQLSIHVVTVRYQKNGTGKSLNALIPVKGDKFSATIDLKAGSYKVWAVIDVKDADGREKQVSSDPQDVNIS